MKNSNKPGHFIGEEIGIEVDDIIEAVTVVDILPHETTEGKFSYKLSNGMLIHDEIVKIDEIIFRYFLRKVYKVEASNEDCDEICTGFSQYLNEKCTPEQLKNFVPSTPLDIIMNDKNPLRHDGFHPAFLLHFDGFVILARKKYPVQNS